MICAMHRAGENRGERDKERKRWRGGGEWSGGVMMVLAMMLCRARPRYLKAIIERSGRTRPPHQQKEDLHVAQRLHQIETFLT